MQGGRCIGLISPLIRGDLIEKKYCSRLIQSPCVEMLSLQKKQLLEEKERIRQRNESGDKKLGELSPQTNKINHQSQRARLVNR
jgi:hypothetical protein